MSSAIKPGDEVAVNGIRRNKPYLRSAGFVVSIEGEYCKVRILYGRPTGPWVKLANVVPIEQVSEDQRWNIALEL